MKKYITLAIIILAVIAVVLIFSVDGTLQLSELGLSDRPLEKATIFSAGQQYELDSSKASQLVGLLEELEYHRCAAPELRAPGATSIVITLVYSGGDEVKITYPCLEYEGRAYMRDGSQHLNYAPLLNND